MVSIMRTNLLLEDLSQLILALFQSKPIDRIYHPYYAIGLFKVVAPVCADALTSIKASSMNGLKRLKFET